MANAPVPPGAVRLTITGEPTAEQTLKAATAMLKILRGIERNMRAAGAIPATAFTLKTYCRLLPFDYKKALAFVLPELSRRA